jgi:hypothetical protein
LIRLVDQHKIQVISYAPNIQKLEKSVGFAMEGIVDVMKIDEFGGFDPTGLKGNRSLKEKIPLPEFISVIHEDLVKKE